MTSILVIGYGNTLRGDDAVGPLVAEAVANLGIPNVRTLIRHQLTPELAETIAGSGAVIFVDAAVNMPGEEVTVTGLIPAAERKDFAHTTDPGSLLALARAVYGRCPPAWVVRVPVANLELGEGLSPLAQRGVDTALREIRKLLIGTQPSPSS